MSYVIITGGIDLSVAGQAVLVGTSGAILMVQGLSLWPALLIMLLIGCILGAINGFFISRLSFPPFIITLAIMNITRGLALYLTQGRTIFNLPVGLGFFGLSYFLGIPIPIWIMIIAFILGHIGLKYTSFGRGVYAVGDNENAAWLSGLNSNKIIFWVYVLQGLLAAIASIVLISRLGSATAAMAKGMELDAIASVVIGGTSLMGGEGNVLGTFVGVLIITIITNIMNLIGFSPFLQDTAKGIVIILAVLLDIWRKGYLGNIKR
jgi:ribose/xylose/arabinose/galactoside ABC-type transport system permease subunit